MNTIEKLKKQSMLLRKNKDPMARFAVLLLSEISNIGKNDGNRETTEDEAIKVMQKMTKTLETVPGEEAKAEIAFMEQFLPQMVSEAELRAFIEGTGANNIGAVMGAVKKEYGTTVDMKLASQIAKEVI